MPEITVKEYRKIDVSYKDIAKIINDKLIENLLPASVRLKYDDWSIDDVNWAVCYSNETHSGRSYVAETVKMDDDMIEKYKAIKCVVEQMERMYG